VRKFYEFNSSFLSYPERQGFNPREIVSGFYFPEGALNVVSSRALTADQCNIMVRFANVFGLTYKRFLDLQKAEAQARESQIETALERVRSRTMGMQKSDELREVIQVIYEQFLYLGIDAIGAGFTMDYQESDDWDIWAADATNSFPTLLHIPYLDHPLWNGWNDAKRK